jgi:Tfp pilus assembly ATPase PilU
MAGILADNDVQGQFHELVQLLGSKKWRKRWESLHVTVETFQTLGLAPEASDRVVWQTCQKRGIVLFTGNRNDESPESLETTIRLQNKINSFPVITLSDPKRFLHDRGYVHRVAKRLLEILRDLDNYRGAGRLWVP